MFVRLKQTLRRGVKSLAEFAEGEKNQNPFLRGRVPRKKQIHRKGICFCASKSVAA